jgi:hypothetical protein
MDISLSHRGFAEMGTLATRPKRGYFSIIRPPLRGAEANVGMGDIEA